MQIKAIIALVLAVAFAISNLISYHAGKTSCLQDQVTAAQDNTRTQVEANVERADTTADGFVELDRTHTTKRGNLDAAVDQNRLSPDCNLSADELRAFQELTATTGSRLP